MTFGKKKIHGRICSIVGDGERWVLIQMSLI